MDENNANNENKKDVENVDSEFDFNDGMDGKTERREPPKSRVGKGKKIALSVGAVFLAAGMFFLGFFTYAWSIDPELRALLKAKTAIQKLYYEEISDDDFYGALFDAINDDLLDPYSWYMDENEYAEFVKEGTGKWSGLGLTFTTMDKDGNAQLYISGVSSNSPAEAAGITAGGYVVGYGATEGSVKYDVVFENFESFLKEYDAGEAFTLCLEYGGERRFISIAKQSFAENYVFYRSKTTAYKFVGENATDETAYDGALPALDDDTAYIRLTQFNGEAGTQFEKAMARFKTEKKKNLVLDLRGNGGGFMDILQTVGGYFCKNSTAESPVIATAKTRRGDTQIFTAKENLYSRYFSADSEIKVLADSGSASASECLIGCMIDYGAIGYDDICLSQRNGVAKTYGKGIMQTTFVLSAKKKTDAIKLTTAKIYWPKGETCIHGRGVLPEDGCLTVAENALGDTEINEALALFFKK